MFMLTGQREYEISEVRVKRIGRPTEKSDPDDKYFFLRVPREIKYIVENLMEVFLERQGMQLSVLQVTAYVFKFFVNNGGFDSIKEPEKPVESQQPEPA